MWSPPARSMWASCWHSWPACEGETRDGIVGQPTDRTRPATVIGASRPRDHDQDSIHGTHQGQRPRPRPKAGHMTASDRRFQNAKTLACRGPSTHDGGGSEDCWENRIVVSSAPLTAPETPASSWP